MIKVFDILMVVGWEVQSSKTDDQRKYPADLLLPNRKYWFFKHWPERDLKIEVMGYRKIPLLSKIEKKFLHFHFFQSLRILHKMKKYDLVIFFHSQIGIVPALYKSIFKIKTPLVLIDVEGLGRKNKWYHLPFIRKAISGIDYLFYLASIQKEDYQRYYPEIINKSDFLPLGIDLTRFSCNGAREEDYIVSIGYQGPDFRDWKTLIKAYSQLNTKTRLLILGREKFEPEEIGYEKIPEGVEFLGKTDLVKLNEIISRAKFVVLPFPERRHAYGQMTLLGCMALGKGVIVSKVSSVTDYLRNKEDGILVTPCKPEALAEKMQFLLDNPDVTDELGKKARSRVQTSLSEPLMAKKIREALQNRGLIRNSSPFDSKILSPSENVLLLGFGYCLHRNTGDKNFWTGLSRELSSELNKLVIVSVNSSSVKFEREGNIYLYNVPLFHHRKKDDQKRLGTRFLKYSPCLRVLQRSVTLLKLVPFLKKLVKSHNIQVIHLMDNFGFLTRLIKKAFPELKVYATAITYNIHKSPLKLYSLYQRVIFGEMDKVVVSSKAYKDKLIEHGFSEEKLQVIRWGIPVSNGKEKMPENGKTYRPNKVILWTGFTQQIKKESFYLSLSIAKNIIRRNHLVDFIFAFKPECFDQEYVNFREEHIQVLTTKPENFQNLLLEVDLLLAPIGNYRSTVAPPLTWIECMNFGIPVISTPVPGVDEILIHNQTGFVAKSKQELEELIERVLEERDLLTKVSTRAKEFIKEKYNLTNIAQDYLRLWRENGTAFLSS